MAMTKFKNALVCMLLVLLFQQACHTQFAAPRFPPASSMPNEQSIKNAALWEAAEDGKILNVQSLLNEGASPHSVDRDNSTALMAAANSGHLDIVRLLLDYGATVKLKDRSGHTALTYAMSYGHSKIVILLLKQGADPNTVTDFKTPLINAVSLSWQEDENWTEVVRLLLHRGATVNNRNMGGYTALMGAAGRGSLPIARMLLAHKADVNLEADYGVTALICAADMHQYAAASKSQIARLLLQKGAKVDAKTTSGVTALMTAARTGATETVRVLLQFGARVTTPEGEKALQIAQQRKRTAIVQLIRQAQVKELKRLGPKLKAVNGSPATNRSNRGMLRAAVRYTGDHINTIRVPSFRGFQIIGVTAGGNLLGWTSAWADQPLARIFSVGVRSGRIERTFMMDEKRPFESIRLSPDGRHVLFGEAPYGPNLTPLGRGNITVLNADTLKVVREIKIGRNKMVLDIAFVNSGINPLLMRLGEWTSDNANNFRLVEYDWQKGVINPVSYSVLFDCTLVAPTPGTVAAFASNGPRDVTDLELWSSHFHTRLARVAVDDSREQQPAQGPFFFISPTQIACGPYLWADMSGLRFNRFRDLPGFRRYRRTPADADTSLRAVGGVGVSQAIAYMRRPNGSFFPPLLVAGNYRQRHSEGGSRVFFATKRGLELWDLKNDRLIHRWPGLRNMKYVQAEPRHGFMLVYGEGNIQVWRFDSKWI